MGSNYDNADQRTQGWLREYSKGGEIRNFTNESPKLTVDVPSFFIDQFPVTNARYRACVEAGVCGEIERTSPDLPVDYASNSLYDDNPVYGIAWNNAMTYCAWVGKRLPTEAEWEKAARGTDGRIYPWGNVWEENYVTPLLSPIGHRPNGASPYQVQDMLKTGGEWTADLIRYYPGNSTSSYGAYEYSVDRSSWRVVRGLSSHSDLFHWVTVRFGVNPVTQGDIGFRCARGQTSPSTLESMLVTIEVPGTPQPVKQVDLSNMAYVPAGTFIMGHTEPYTNSRGINERANAMPTHVVDLSAFFIDRYKVTYSDYAKFVNELGGHALACSGFNCVAVRRSDDPLSFADRHILLKDGQYQVDPGFEDFPVNHVTWYGAEAYCTWQGKRLPTEAEWEKAARGTDGRLYPWGNDWDSQATANLLHLYPIGSQPLNLSPYGTYDMWGNRTEWVADWYASNYYQYSPLDNPTGPLESKWRIQRALGGRIGGLPDRIALEPDSYSGSFRCAYSYSNN